MSRNCNNCYWKLSNDDWCIKQVEETSKKICSEHSYECTECDEQATHEYEHKQYCAECLLKEMNVETYQVTHYMIDGEYLGDEDELDEIIEKLGRNVKQLEI